MTGMRLAEVRRCETCERDYHPWGARTRFCSRACRDVWWAREVQADAVTAANARLAQMRAAGDDPAHSGFATEARSRAVARSNRERPRRARRRDGAA